MHEFDSASGSPVYYGHIFVLMINFEKNVFLHFRARRQMSERWLDHYRTLVALHALNATDYRVCGNIIGCGLVDIEKRFVLLSFTSSGSVI